MATSKISNNKVTNLDNRNWCWLLALGILFVILGGLGLSMTIGITVVSMLFFGVLLLIAGISQIIDTFHSRHWKGILWHALIAVLYIIGGCIIIYDPFLASTLITAMLAGVLIVIGLTRMLMALSLRGSEEGWGWLFLAGLTALVLGILILMHWPVSGLWMIGLFIAIELMVDGWSYILVSLSMRSANKLKKQTLV